MFTLDHDRHCLGSSSVRNWNETVFQFFQTAKVRKNFQNYCL